MAERVGALLGALALALLTLAIVSAPAGLVVACPA